MHSPAAVPQCHSRYRLKSRRAHVCTGTDWAHPATSAPGPTELTPAIANAEDAKARAEREAKEEKEYRDLEVEKILSQVGPSGHVPRLRKSVFRWLKTLDDPFFG